MMLLLPLLYLMLYPGYLVVFITSNFHR